MSAALVLGGCDLNGPHLYHIYPHGSTGKLPYVTMGSGSLAAMSVFECGWKEDMEEAEAIEVCATEAAAPPKPSRKQTKEGASACSASPSSNGLTPPLCCRHPKHPYINTVAALSSCVPSLSSFCVHRHHRTKYPH